MQKEISLQWEIELWQNKFVESVAAWVLDQIGASSKRMKSPINKKHQIEQNSALFFFTVLVSPLITCMNMNEPHHPTVLISDFVCSMSVMCSWPPSRCWSADCQKVITYRWLPHEDLPIPLGILGRLCLPRLTPRWINSIPYPPCLPWSGRVWHSTRVTGA